MIIDFRVTVPMQEWTKDENEAKNLILNSYMRGSELAETDRVKKAYLGG
jgi:hypothetical protein